MIRWRDRFQPDRAPVPVRNPIGVPAMPGRVSAWPVGATLRPKSYTPSSKVVLEGGGADSTPSVRFRWRTFGLSLCLRVEELVSPTRLSRTGRSFGVDVYPPWLISGPPTGGYVLTDESQYGVPARQDHARRPRRMESLHQLGLVSLRATVASGSPLSR